MPAEVLARFAEEGDAQVVELPVAQRGAEVAVGATRLRAEEMQAAQLPVVKRTAIALHEAVEAAGLVQGVLERGELRCPCLAPR